MTAKIKPVGVKGEVPPDYTRPVYYRPERQVPLKAKVINDRPLREEFLPADPYTRISERVYDEITSLEPSRHAFVPIDPTRPDGRIERYYAMFQFKAYLGQVLHAERNRLELFIYPSGAREYRDPPWLSRSSADRDHFGYLDSSVIGDRQLFLGTNGVEYFSPKLFEAVKKFGDILPKLYYFVPIGVA